MIQMQVSETPRDNRVVSINFSYRFGKQMNNSNQRKRSSNEEQNRVRTGD